MRTDPITAGILAQLEEERSATEAEMRQFRQKAVQDLAKVPVDPKRLSDWLRGGWFTCPGTAGRYTCIEADCAAGAACRTMAGRGLYGDGSEMPRKARPVCGARTRAGRSCAMRVEPGKHRCRLHGGLSTGPKTAEGRARIGEANRARWAASREKGDGAGLNSIKGKSKGAETL